jgi:hypothetical protein
MKTPYSALTRATLHLAGYEAASQPAIAALTAFAAQRSGLDPRNYYSASSDRAGQAALRKDHRQIGRDWQRYKDALREAAREGVKDADVIAAAPRTFSGRLSWVDGQWKYCTGQYFPTEYRRAAATLLEAAISRVRQARPQVEEMVTTITELKALHRRNGGGWFEADAMRFFGTRLESPIVHGHYFITSEQPPAGPRLYSVRSFDKQGVISTEGEFCAHRSKNDALQALQAQLQASRQHST